jgi:hypothetical protein
MAMLLHGHVEAVDQNLFVEWLCQKAERSIVERPFADTFVGDGCNDYKRHPVPLVAQKRLHLDTAHGRHADVSDYAPGIVKLSRVQEVLGGGKRADDVPKRSDEIV